MGYGNEVKESESMGEDHFSLAGFTPERVFEMEGKITEYRYASHCHETVYNCPEDIIHMAEAENKGKVPTEAIPKEIAERSIGVDRDIAAALEVILKTGGKQE